MVEQNLMDQLRSCANRLPFGQWQEPNSAAVNAKMQSRAEASAFNASAPMISQVTGLDGAFNAACDRITTLEADLQLARDLVVQMTARVQQWQAAAEKWRAQLDDAVVDAPDTSTEAVQRRVDGVIDDLVAGRTSPGQRRGLGSAVERADRVKPGADAAVGRALGLTNAAHWRRRS